MFDWSTGSESWLSSIWETVNEKSRSFRWSHGNLPNKARLIKIAILIHLKKFISEFRSVWIRSIRLSDWKSGFDREKKFTEPVFSPKFPTFRRLLVSQKKKRTSWTGFLEAARALQNTNYLRIYHGSEADNCGLHQDTRDNLSSYQEWQKLSDFFWNDEMLFWLLTYCWAKYFVILFLTEVMYVSNLVAILVTL